MLLDATHVPVPAHGSSPWHRAELAAQAFLLTYSNQLTRDAYLIDLRLWFRWLEECRVTDPVQEVERTHVELFLRHMERQGRKPGTIDRRIGTLNRFYEWLLDEEYRDGRNPTRRVKRPTVPADSSTPWLTRRELADWIDAGEARGGDDAIVALILGLNGLRVGELCSCDVESLGSDRYHHTLSFIGKGSRPATVPLPPRTMETLHVVLAGRPTGPLVLNRYGNRATRINVARTVTRIAKAAGITTPVTPHSIRHSSITALAESGVSMRDVEAFARHADPRSTRRYDRSRNSLDRHASYALQRELA